MSASTELIALVVTVVGVGVAAQLFSDWLSVPSVLFWLAAGVAVGPEGLGIITPTAIDGGSLSAIVGLSVAVIVFEGAFALKIDRLREAPRETLRLVTLGAIISHLGTALVVRFALGTSWELALLIGSLLIATGPTVITPILEVVPVRERVATTLETEGVVNDVTAAILAIVMFEYLLLEGEGLPTLIGQFTYRLGAGVLVGVAVAGVVWLLLARVELPTENAPRNARLVVLASALVAYGVAEAGLGVAESGIAAVASAGFLLGNVDLPYREQIEQFKGDVTLVVLTFVFVVLASLLSLSDLRSLGIGGIAVVLVVALVVRPLLVFLSTIGGRFTFRERLFVSAIGPRGIIPASVVTLFALQLGESQPEAATTLVGTVFLVIFATVAFQGGLARHIAQALDVIPMRTIVVGGGRIGRALADRLEDRGEEVTIVEQDSETVESLREAGYRVTHGDGTDRDVLLSAGADNAKVVAAATPDDDVNLLVGQLARNTFDVETVVARVNQPDNEDAFQDLDIEAISTGMSVAWSMDNVIERPAIARWMTELDRTGDVQEIEVTAAAAAGRTVADLADDLPEDCYIGLIGRDDENRIPHADDRIERDDHVTIIGRTEAVREAIDYFTA
ncbi:potassium transporter [Halorientalis sp. IM1011]|uniref:cation:proton antiporter n=1 Tax=Halorientalis sp. IM1011 TaxID=1932360 RepID=UPI00097CD6E8|nr:cation:proton antiporter [Halorientalis sp. IM1011]AQL43767.1 potassium transporter [Halorientalis sp. IM1011]